MIDPETGEIVKSEFRSMKLNEISSVDRPAQPTALMSIMKRAPKSEEDALEAEDEGEDPKKKKKKGKNPFAKGATLTSSTDGHQHLLSNEVGPDARSAAGQTGGEQDGEGRFHQHPWVLDNGVLAIGEVNGHSHEVPAGFSKQAEDGMPDPTDASTSSGATADSVGTVQQKAIMSNENDTTADDAVAKQLDEITKRAERAEAVSELNDAQRSIFKSLDSEGQSAFLALSPDARQAEVAKAADANAVVDTVDGVEYRKNDDPRLLALAKSAAAEKALRIAGEAKAADADLRKRAEGLSNLPGTVEVRMSILKGIDMLPEADQAPALEALKAQDAGMAKAFSRSGTSAVPSTSNVIEDIAKALRAADVTLSPEMAMVKALETPEGAEAYAKSLGF